MDLFQAHSGVELRLSKSRAAQLTSQRLKPYGDVSRGEVRRGEGGEWARSAALPSGGAHTGTKRETSDENPDFKEIYFPLIGHWSEGSRACNPVAY